MKPALLPSLALTAVLAVAPIHTQTPPVAPPEPPGVVFGALAGGVNPAPQTITLANTTGSPLQVTSSQPSWLSVTIANQAATATVAFSVDLTGVPAGVQHAVVDLASSNSKLLKKLYVWLAAVQPLPNDSAYQVEFRYVGYTGLAEGYPDCAVNPRGFDMLTGVIAGREAVAPGDDVQYRGALGRVTNIDICETRGKKGPGDDERVWCAARLTGVAGMNVELEVYGESGRGAWLKAEPDGSWFTAVVQGACERADMVEWEQEYPDGSTGGSPDGQPIAESRLHPMFSGGRARLVPGLFPPQGPTGRFGQVDGWELNVLKKLK